MSIAQVVSVNPIIFAAESYEVVENSDMADAHDHGSHSHDHGHSHDAHSWAPEDGHERTGYTVVANVFAGIGFAAIVLALMSQLYSQGVIRISLLIGAAWGVAGFLTFFVAPGLGLPPEIPGINAAPLAQRQLWWVFAVTCVGCGLLTLAYAPIKFKVLGMGLLVLPYIVNIPHIEGPAFTHPDPDVVVALTELHHQFILASGVSNFVFWLVLGITSAWVLNAWVLKGAYIDQENRESANV